MKILFKNECSKPIVSLILLDWSCRESFHTLKYLSEQTVPRDQYEIIWIEYYNRCSIEISEGLKESEQLGKPPIVDKWIAIEMPEDVYYHKHLMYNIGIVVSRGEIVVICDSDAIVKPTFIDSIIKAFKKDSNIVLHMDEVRNVDKRFHPFQYPSFNEIIGKGCINWVAGKTTGVLEKKDPIHVRNYGACMCALRENLLSIGGADEHIDYLGHICGPYDMTFRLVNAGKKEVWHQEEFLYHVWHPGTDGLNNYLGPHDGKNVSSTALEAIEMKRILPLLENPAIKLIRLQGETSIDHERILEQLINKDTVDGWRINDNKFQMSLGRIAYHRKEYSKALAHWKKMSDLSVVDRQFLGEFGWAYYFMSEYDAAIKVFDRALSVNSDNQFACVGLGWAHIQKGAFAQAKIILERAIRMKSSGSSEILKDAFRGLAVARDALRQARCKAGKNNFKDTVVQICLNVQHYSAKITQRIKKGNFTIPQRFKNKAAGYILKIFHSQCHDTPERKLIKGEAEYLEFKGYPCDIPTFKVQPDLDFLLLEIPPRYFPMMPNGLSYVHNILMKCGINFQTIDMNIITYHRFHERRLRERLDYVVTSSGYVMKEDPWDNANMSEWDKPEVIAHFMAELESLLTEIVRNKPKAVGISLSGNNRSLVKAFVKELRRRVPQTVIVVGGYDCVYYGLGQHLFSDFDYMVIGEAELTLEPLIKALAQGKRPKDLIGIVSRYDSPGRVWFKPPLLQDLDMIDFPRYQWANHVWYQDCERRHFVPITSSRGCHWARCRFCGECFAFRRRTPAKVADEIEYHTKYGFHAFHFNESDVNGDPQALHDLCSEIIRRELKVKFLGQLRIDRRNTEAYFKHLAKAGFTHLRFGVDGWTDNLLKLQNKGYNMEIVFQNLRDCSASGITTTVNMVIGVPGETEDDIDEAIRNIVSCKNYISVVESFNTLLLVCGSEYHRNPDKYKIHFRKDREEIYASHVHYIPAELWYSEEPYIDQDVRMRRMEKIISELYKVGVNIGSFASKVVENLRSEHSKATEVEISKANIGKSESAA